MIYVNNKEIQVTGVTPHRIPVPTEPRFIHATPSDAWRECEKTGADQFASTARPDVLFRARKSSVGTAGHYVLDFGPDPIAAVRVDFTLDGKPDALIFPEGTTRAVAERTIAQRYAGECA
jgi:hypothetical protein